MNKELTWNRRRFFDAAGRISAGVIAGACSGRIVLAQSKGAKEEKADEIGPTEDLMREHGVLNRVLLVYDHFVVQIEQKRDLKPEWISNAASIIRNFVEDYHERQEEQFLFPRFERAHRLADLTSVLKTQHLAGRKLTDQIVSLAKARDSNDRAKLAQSLQQFVRMYRPHEAREDTVLFPELRKIVSAHEFDALGEQFEANEHKQFGADGFELYRDKVMGLDKQLGIYDLAQFTPPSSIR